jgi:acetate kinase
MSEGEAHQDLSGSAGSHDQRVIVTVNGGSSSIKFAAFVAGAFPDRLLSGQIERIGSPDTRIVAKRGPAGRPDVRPIEAATMDRAAEHLIGYLRERLGGGIVAGIGHRIVHGGAHLLEHQVVNERVLAELRRAVPLDLAHLPREIALVDAFGGAFPSVPQVACFDTAFHRDLPRVATLMPIPRHYFNEGIRRYGFHGLSYTYLMQRLVEVAGPVAAGGRIILAHLGSGASMAAVRGGKPIDTTMGFTPTSGLVMGTRPGDLDPGLLAYLVQSGSVPPDELSAFVSQKCGLLGVSETSSDVRDLLDRRASDPRASEAIDLFCYQARKFVGSLCVALGGLDTLVFSGGIGEHSSQIRAGICDGLEALGVSVDPGRNAAGEPVISAEGSRVTVRVIPTDEEFVIARETLRVMRSSISRD